MASSNAPSACHAIAMALAVFGPASAHAFTATFTTTPIHGSSGTHASPLLPSLQPPQPRRQLARASVMSASIAGAPTARSFGPRRLLGYLWPERGAGSLKAKLRVVASLVLLLLAKLFVVRLPFIFKRCVDSLSASGGTALVAPAGWMLFYGFSRAVYTLLQEARYLFFTPVGQNALRRFMRDAFEHVQALDASWLGAQSSGELSRVFARGVRGMQSRPSSRRVHATCPLQVSSRASLRAACAA